MNQSIYNQLITNIFLKKKGVLIFSEDFSDIGNSKSISKNLEILVNEGILLRVARGIYYLPKIDKQMGALLPDIEQVAKAIAEREKARIVSSGLSAIQKLGLSTQVPLKAVYYTDGSPRKLKIGKTSLIEEHKRIVIEKLKKEEKVNILHDAKLAPVWIRNIMLKTLNHDA